MSETKSINGDASDARDVRVGQVLNDYLDRKKRGEAQPQAQFLANHPDIADELRELLAMVQDVEPPSATIDKLIDQGVLERCEEPGYPARCGAYKVCGLIGRGGMGVVLEAYEPSLDRTVALKVLRHELACDATAVARFQREAKAAAALNHPNIITVYAVGQVSGVHFLAMEYINSRSGGSSLADLIRRHGPLDADTARHIFRQLLSGLEAAHTAGLIHRDIKSSNALVQEATEGASEPQPSGSGHDSNATTGGASEPQPSGSGHDSNATTWGFSTATVSERPTEPDCRDPQSPIVNHQSSIVKIADFGLARMVNAQTRITMPDSIFGTPEYMSPEQASGERDIDHHTDLYSAGVILYEMLTGRTPFKADTPSAVVHQILNNDPPDPKTIAADADPHLAALALRLMAKSPEDRFDSAADAMEALDASVPVRPPARRRRVRRHLTRALLAAIVLTGGVWPAFHFAFREPKISAVRIDPELPHIVQVRYGDGAAWKAFHTFPPEVECVYSVEILDLDGVGNQAVVAGPHMPLHGCNLFTFDTGGNEIWRLDISTDPSIRDWPDCTALAHWSCPILVRADLDGDPGDELVVRASDAHNYPTRISIIDPRAGAIRTTFWHMGQLQEIRIQPDFFGPGRPALIAWGLNNKLDGFGLPLPPRPYQCPPGEDQPRTGYDLVSVCMILDPNDMNGLGPPRNRRVDIPPARPFAYAFLDMPASVRGGTYIPDGQTELVFPQPSEVGFITVIRVVPRVPTGNEAPWMKVQIGRAPSAGNGAILTVDRNLELRDVEPATGAKFGTTELYWRKRWKLIIQNRQYLDW